LCRSEEAMKGAFRRIVVATLAVSAGAACHVGSSLERLTEARRLSADLQVNFTKATGAASKAVMADTDEASAAFAREAEQAKQAVDKEAGELKPLLDGLGYSDEAGLLEVFLKRFGEYRALDRTILELAVENTNLKAQRLSFGPAGEAVDAFREAVEGVVPLDPKDTWRVTALVATAVSNLRQIQVLQAPHIAEADDARMTRMEVQMQTSEAAARSALGTLGALVQPASRPRLTSASAALDRFIAVNAQITALSRRNTNVRSLALSLNEKGKLTAACEDSLRALRDRLAARGFAGTR